jgi:hypothetical protein
LIAQTGKPQPNISTTFIGRSKPLEDVCKQIPKSAQPEKKKNHEKKYFGDHLL